MKKKDIIEMLKDVDNSKYIVVGDSSLVLHKLKRECDCLELDSLIRIDQEKVKVNIVNELDEYDEIDNIKCLSIKKCLERLKNDNNIYDKAII